MFILSSMNDYVTFVYFKKQFPQLILETSRSKLYTRAHVNHVWNKVMENNLTVERVLCVG